MTIGSDSIEFPSHSQPRTVLTDIPVYGRTMTIGSDSIEFPSHSQPGLSIIMPVIQQFGDSFEDSHGNVFRIEKVFLPGVDFTV